MHHVTGCAEQLGFDDVECSPDGSADATWIAPAKHDYVLQWLATSDDDSMQHTSDDEEELSSSSSASGVSTTRRRRCLTATTLPLRAPRRHSSS